ALWLDAHAIGTLPPAPAFAMVGADRAPRQQRSIILRNVDLAWLATQRVNARVERTVAAARCVDGQGADHQRGFEHGFELEQRRKSERGGGLSTVDKREAFLGT